jgi:hypothetical protein
MEYTIPPLFILDDDFELIRRKYFREIIDNKSWEALPGGVQDNFSPFYKNFPIVNLTQDKMSGYKIDSGKNLNYLKEKLLPLLKEWEGREIELDEFSICPNATFAINICLLAMRFLGVEETIHETPAYFGTVELSKLHKLKTTLLPTHSSNEFYLSDNDIARIKSQKHQFCVILTQPKIGTGLNRDIFWTKNILKNIPNKSFVLIDEAADRSFPSLTPNFEYNSDQIFRVKGIFKGLGLNGLKGSIIYHHSKYKELLSSLIEFNGGTIDSYSTETLSKLTENPAFFKYALNYASDYISKGTKIVEKELIGSNINFNPIENGYIGLVEIPFGNNDFFKTRENLLRKAKKIKCPLVLGSSMYFPYNGNSEWIRFNFFSTLDNIEKSARKLYQLSFEIFTDHL